MVRVCVIILTVCIYLTFLKGHCLNLFLHIDIYMFLKRLQTFLANFRAVQLVWLSLYAEGFAPIIANSKGAKGLGSV